MKPIIGFAAEVVQTLILMRKESYDKFYSKNAKFYLLKNNCSEIIDELGKTVCVAKLENITIVGMISCVDAFNPSDVMVLVCETSDELKNMWDLIKSGEWPSVIEPVVTHSEEPTRPMPCPICNSINTTCKYEETGTYYYWDSYSYSCYDCGYTDKKGEGNGVYMYSDPDYTNCPFCGESSKSHPPIKKNNNDKLDHEFVGNSRHTLEECKTHNWGAWRSNEEEHSRTCITCGVIQTGKHSFVCEFSLSGYHDSCYCSICEFGEKWMPEGLT